jgi:hypothetical protein
MSGTKRNLSSPLVDADATELTRNRVVHSNGLHAFLATKNLCNLVPAPFWPDLIPRRAASSRQVIGIDVPCV